MKLCKDCGGKKASNEKLYCKKCGYKHRVRPNGLKYNIVKENQGWNNSNKVFDKAIRFKNGEYSYRKMMLSKYKNICEECRQTSNNIQIHHKDENRQNNNKNNLMILCPSCHQKIYHKRTFWKNQYGEGVI